MDLATEVYMNRVNGCSCEETRIQLYCGANLTVDQEKRTHLLQYLKGSLEQKQKLRVLQPDLYVIKSYVILSKTYLYSTCFILCVA